ncbi:MAG TPA: SDR family oxidoreductase [Pyrinomonadaceae bacterium]|jgi:3-oxoacyl-[acyl-carrier protein] reductase|nr:SDR family oxidoreductase [Pyrinomonadaceae bacterium]
MDLRLSGKVAVITGASRGIGRAIAETLAAEGMRLVLAARSGEQLDALAKSLPTETLVRVTDLREPDAPAAVIADALERFQQLDLLVNNAGATARGDFLKLTDDQWEDGFALKFYGAMRAARAAWPHLQASGGAIINIVGVGGRTPSADFAIGGAVNAALLNLTKALAERGVRDGVRVNAVNPGATATERLQTRLERYASEHGVERDEAARRMSHALGVARFGEPSEIARAVAFLASPQAAFCQGAILDVDGGQTRTL